MINRRALILSSLAFPIAANASPFQPGSRDEFLYSIGDRCFFGFDHYELDAAALHQLDRQVDWFIKYPWVSATIEGHCDERGTRVYNLTLGERRAYLVKEYFVTRGIDPHRFQTISYGKERPAVLGSNEAAWSQNRRVVIVLNS